MKQLFEDFLKKFPPAGELRKPTEETLEQYRGILPEDLLDFWQEYGFGNYGGGLLKVIDPTDYRDNLFMWLGGADPNKVPILMTGFGNMFYYRKLSETEDDVCMLDIHYRRTMNCSYSFGEFFQHFMQDDELPERLLDKKLFEEATKQFGALKEPEIFFFAPALAYGGSETVECIQKGDAAVHQDLLFGMLDHASEDKETGDAWSDAYEANPHVYERNDGTLMVNFTLTETTDTILPKAPENMYAVEGQTISLWILSFFSLTKNDNLNMLEYHAALELLQPYIVDEREEHVLLRGLSLEEMESVLSEAAQS